MNLLRILFCGAMAMLAWHMLGGGPAAGSVPFGTFFGVLACFAGIAVLGWKGTTGTHARGGGTPRLFRVAAWLSLVLMVLFWLGVATRGPVREMVVIWEETFDPRPVGSDAGETQAEETTGHLDWDEGSRRVLPRQTNIKPGKKPEVFLRIEDRAEAARMSKGPIYVSSIAYDQYQDSAWQIATESRVGMQMGSEGVIRLNQDERGNGIWHTIVISAEAKRRTPLVALQGVSRVEGVKSLERWSSALHLLPVVDDPQNGYRYRAYSLPKSLKDIPESDRCELAGSHDASWLRMPQDDLGKRISELATQVTAGNSPKETASLIQSYLQKSYRYSLSTTNSRNLDPLENFLFGEKSGHCEYFATAGALMARARGIPSRVMYGWAGGTWYEYADWFVFRADEAHVWVEVWLGNHGWVVMDPTPPDAIRSQVQNQSTAKLPTMPGLAGTTAELPEEEARQSTSLVLWAVSALIAVVGLVVLLRPSVRARDGEDGGIVPEPWRERVAMHYMEEWKKAAKSRLPRRHAGSSTLRQQLMSVHPPPEFSHDLASYHYCVRYEGRPRDRAQERKLMRRIHAWAAESRE
jgi:Transglutaminase-like superfamily